MDPNFSARDLLDMIDLRKSRNRWRFIALLLVLLLATWALTASMPSLQQQKEPKDYVARIQIQGMLLDDAHALKRLQELHNDPHAKAVLVEVNSPGGTMVAGLDLFKALRRVGEEKPMVVRLGSVAASAGYLVALASDHIVASEATLTGSIGVFMPLIDATNLANKVGIESEAVVSGELKAVTSPLWQRDEGDRAYLQDMVNTLSEVFYDYLQQRRPGLPATTLEKIKDGRAIAGITALEMGLVDALGGQREALSWLQKEHNIPGSLSLRDFDLDKPRHWLVEALEAHVNLDVFGSTQQLWQPSLWSLTSPNLMR